jgi:hypothetical protein
VIKNKNKNFPRPTNILLQLNFTSHIPNLKKGGIYGIPINRRLYNERQYLLENH